MPLLSTDQDLVVEGGQRVARFPSLRLLALAGFLKHGLLALLILVIVFVFARIQQRVCAQITRPQRRACLSVAVPAHLRAVTSLLDQCSSKARELPGESTMATFALVRKVRTDWTPSA